MSVTLFYGHSRLLLWDCSSRSAFLSLASRFALSFPSANQPSKKFVWMDLLKIGEPPKTLGHAYYNIYTETRVVQT